MAAGQGMLCVLPLAGFPQGLPWAACRATQHTGAGTARHHAMRYRPSVAQACSGKHACQQQHQLTVPKPPAPSLWSRPSGRLAILSWSGWMRHSKLCGSWKASCLARPGESVLQAQQALHVRAGRVLLPVSSLQSSP